MQLTKDNAKVKPIDCSHYINGEFVKSQRGKNFEPPPTKNRAQ